MRYFTFLQGKKFQTDVFILLENRKYGMHKSNVIWYIFIEKQIWLGTNS
jgi:hypothetical protein